MKRNKVLNQTASNRETGEGNTLQISKDKSTPLSGGNQSEDRT